MKLRPLKYSDCYHYTTNKTKKNMKKSAHQIWTEYKEQNLTKEEFKENLIKEGVIIKKKDKSYPEPICQDCGELCTMSEEVDTGGGNEKGSSYIELWCYCKKCDRETNHAIPSDNDNYPE